MGWLSKVFELNPAGLNWPRGVMILDVALVPLVVFWAIGHEEYLSARCLACCLRRWPTREAASGTARRASLSLRSSAQG